MSPSSGCAGKTVKNRARGKRCEMDLAAKPSRPVGCASISPSPRHRAKRERSRQPGEKRHIPDWIDRRPEGRKIFADLDQKRRHGKSAFYPDTNDRSSTRKVVASAASPHRTHEMISYRLTILDFARRAGSIRFQGNYKNSSDALFRSIGTCLGPDNARLRAND
jgi:hypothetical protein